MFDERGWQTLINGSGCPLCRTAERAVVAALPSGRVELVNDADLRGYCILVFHRHVVELYELGPEERAHFIEDVARVARAIAAQFQPDKFNYEMLGNTVPHLHCHIVPRYRTERYWGQPLWVRPPDQLRQLSAADYADLVSTLRTALTGT